ncbi:DNA polymerase III subunit delta' [Helicobacter japonicus]|uniref:DNA polymerase III subunit delta n=2 Tax=Helicobacter japonicus TaxID=425400 RepID=A0A4U8TIT1_9HELI|nr:DNA polymerase III subunit delta' [Helicobacter japonicus]MDE7236108.1 DNA polymerase III subunit delta' [Helicobacter japonicus]TLD99955.1 DNA polymerase III subunit delta' [Helicobacter japonicus]
MTGLIHITPFAKNLIDELTENQDEQYYEIYEREDFKIDDAKEVIAKSYLIYEQEMLIIISANKYNIAAQNALLKIIEEPPQNVQFIIITKNKNALIPTIRSRMRLITHKHKTQIPPFELELKKLNLESIYNFCKQNDNTQLSKEETKMQIQSLLFALYEAKISLTQKELALFDKAIALNQNDASERHNYIFLPLLLRIYSKQKNQQ